MSQRLIVNFCTEKYGTWNNVNLSSPLSISLPLSLSPSHSLSLSAFDICTHGSSPVLQSINSSRDLLPICMCVMASHFLGNKKDIC